MRRHEVKWHPMTMTITITITIGMRPYSHPSSQFTKQTQWPTTIYVQLWTMNCEMQWFLVLLRRKYSNLFLCWALQSEKRFSVAQPSHSFFDSREPLLPPKRASFFQKWKKWHFLLEKVCHVVNPRYLCIWKRTRGEATTLWIVAIAKRGTRLVLVFPECLRFRRRRKAQGNAAAETLHKQEVFDIFAYWFFSRLGGWNLYVSSG